MVNGTYAKKNTYLQVKYPEEVRLSLGVAQVKIGDNIVGKRAVPFDYSAKVLLSISDYEMHIEKEIRRVRRLSGKAAPWYQNTRKDVKELWEEESVKLLKGCGKKSVEFLEKHRITTILHLKQKSIVELTAIAEKGNAIRKLIGFKVQAESSLEGAPPAALVVDHTKEANPYKSLYGEEWEQKIGESHFMKKYICVTKLIKHIHDKSAAVMKGTEYENDWYFYHDALSLMTANRTITWMKEQGYYKRWVLPLGINKGTLFSADQLETLLR